MRTLRSLLALGLLLAPLACAQAVDSTAPPPLVVAAKEVLVEPGAREVDVGDVDGDGAPDLLVTFGDPASFAEDHGLALRRSGQRLERQRILVGVASARLGDVDGDGFDDVVVADGQGLGVLRGSATGTTPMDLRRSGREKGLLALRTRDGAAEALAVDDRGSLAIAALGLPHVPSAEIDLAPATVVLVADADGDGREDLLLGLPSGELGIRRGRGATFEAAAYLLGPRRPTAVAVGGSPPLVAATRGTHLLVVAPEDAGFRLRASLEIAREALALAIADLDGDAAPDLVLVSPGHVDALCDLGGASRPCLSEDAPWERPMRPRVADLDADGTPELLVAEPSIGVHVLRFARPPAR